ncbi:MAG TPA: lasso peptide biosynthesis B2 protein [Pyrinomonadaceae bacterium]|nr:lasso peptide biosynthesis B2 protein [Pyrinomonadaceae bacterium]
MPQPPTKLLQTLLRAGRFAAREPRKSLVVVRMACWVSALSLLVRFLPLSRALGLLTPRRRPAPPADPEAVRRELARLLDLLLAADFWIFTPTCWKRAPVLHRFLALRGIETRVVFGVRRGSGGGALDGHAWLEAGGQPILEPTAPDYKVTFSHPS